MTIPKCAAREFFLEKVLSHTCADITSIQVVSCVFQKHIEPRAIILSRIDTNGINEASSVSQKHDYLRT